MSITGEVALPKAGFVSAVLMTTLHALSKVGLTYMAMPVGSARVTALLAPPSSQITRVGVARAELARSIAPKAIAAKYLIMLCVIYFVCFVDVFQRTCMQLACQHLAESENECVTC